MSIFLAARQSVCVVAFLLLSLPGAFAYSVLGSSPKPFQRDFFVHLSACPAVGLPSLCVFYV